MAKNNVANNGMISCRLAVGCALAEKGSQVLLSVSFICNMLY